MSDVMLSSLGLIGQSDANALGAASTSATIFGDVGNGSSTGFPSWTVSVPIAKTYLLHVSVRNFMTVPGSTVTYYQVVVDGNVISQPVASSRVVCNASNTYSFASWQVPISFSSTGNHTIKLQWKVDSGATANVDTIATRMFTLVGC
jgi:hypothetical protein